MNWFQFGLGAAAALALSFLLHTVDVNRLEKIHAKELSDQAARLEGLCKNDQKLTKEKNDGLQKDLDAIRGKLAASRMQPARCIVPSASETNMADVLEQHARQNGISSHWLSEYGAECESIRVSYNSCTSFVDAVWDSRGQ